MRLDADETLAQIALDIALRTLFGGGFSEDMDQVSHHIKVLSEVGFHESASPITLPDYLSLQGKRRKKAEMSFMRDLLRRLVDDRLNGPPVDELLQVLIETHGGDRQEICDDAMSLLIAGHETSGTALSWIFARLLEHPGAPSCCQDEIAQTHDVQRMLFLQACIEKALRLFPPGYTLFLRQALLHKSPKTRTFPFPGELCPKVGDGVTRRPNANACTAAAEPALVAGLPVGLVWLPLTRCCGRRNQDALCETIG